MNVLADFSIRVRQYAEQKGVDVKKSAETDKAPAKPKVAKAETKTKVSKSTAKPAAKPTKASTAKKS
jgi:hypothetical protein